MNRLSFPFKQYRRIAVSVALAVILAINPINIPTVFAGEGDAVSDTKLKQALLDLSADTSEDGEISEEELTALTGALLLNDLEIADITGLEYATNISSLDLSNNQLQNIDALSGLTQLESLDVSDNDLDITDGSDDMTVIASLLDAGCSVTYTPQNIPVTGISLDKSRISLYQGNTETLIATVAPSDATNTTVTWSSSETSIATVSSSGVVTAVASGTAVITATTEDSGFESDCTVTVTQPVSSVSLNKSTLQMCKGDKVTLTATVKPSDATNKTVTWSSSKTSVATVSSSGVVTAVSTGKAVITATTADGGFKATCTVTIKSSSLATSVYTIDKTNNLLKNVFKDTSVAQLKANLSNDLENLTVYDKSGNEYTGKAVGTGMRVKLIINNTVRDSLTIVVLGDGDGDGTISVNDYTLVRLHILGLKSLSSKYRKACDINGDGKLTIADYTLMRLDLIDRKRISGYEQYVPEVSNAKIKAFINVALAQYGEPYIWGDEGPNSFDCSGYVYYCLRQVGYSIGRTTANSYSTYYKWKYVSKANLQPGDLMFYDSDSDPNRIGHVGIYLGNGYHIHASSDYGCVLICKFDGWYAKKFSHGMRVFY